MVLKMWSNKNDKDRKSIFVSLFVHCSHLRSHTHTETLENIVLVQLFTFIWRRHVKSVEPSEAILICCLLTHYCVIYWISCNTQWKKCTTCIAYTHLKHTISGESECLITFAYLFTHTHTRHIYIYVCIRTIMCRKVGANESSNKHNAQQIYSHLYICMFEFKYRQFRRETWTLFACYLNVNFRGISFSFTTATQVDSQ